jgi:LPS export ABC transporter protein LptC
MITLIRHLPIIGIVALLAVVGFYLIKSESKGPEDSPPTDTAEDESFRLKNIHYIQENPDGGAKWILDADEVRFSEDRQYISFNNFHLKLESENDFAIELLGKNGSYDKTADEIKLSGNLEGHTDNGYTIATDQILYKQKKGHLNTDAPVEITGPFFSVAGKGLHVNLNTKTIEVTNSTTTVIERGSLSL